MCISQVIDGDEFWHPAQLLRSLSLIASLVRNTLSQMQPNPSEEEVRATVAHVVPFARGQMAT